MGRSSQVTYDIAHAGRYEYQVIDIKQLSAKGYHGTHEARMARVCRTIGPKDKSQSEVVLYLYRSYIQVVQQVQPIVISSASENNYFGPVQN